MKNYVFLFVLLVTMSPLSSQMPERPDFSGVWELQGNPAPNKSVFTYKHDATSLFVSMSIHDNMGTRKIDLQAPMDGKPHHQTCLGHDCTLTAQWFGKSLIWETRRDSDQGIFANRRIMTLTSHDTIHAVETRIFPAPERTWDEYWKRVGAK